MKNYRLPKEIKKRMERELRQYYDNKNKLEYLKIQFANEKINTRTLLYLEERLLYVENVYKRLKPFEKEIYDLIFREKCDVLYCETHKHITKNTYYNILNKSILYLAEEWGEI